MLASVVRLLVLVLIVGSALGCGGSGTGFTLLTTPTISGVTPVSAAPGGSVTITGTNLNGTYTSAVFTLTTGAGNVYSSNASSGSTTSVVVVLPTGMPAGTYSLYVQTSDANGDTSSPSSSVNVSVI